MADVKPKKKSKWLKLRHRIVKAIGSVIFLPYARRKYGIDCLHFKDQGKRPYLVLMNHQTLYDQFFISMAFKGAVYFVASEDIFSNGLVSKLIKFLVAPIPIKKQVSDPQAIRDCVNVAKEGGTIAIAPEGNRTYDGRSVYMNPAIASLAKLIKLPIALFRIEGGYGVHPRWSNEVRKGRMRAYVSEVIEYEEYKSLSKEELYNRIKDGLYVDDNEAGGNFESKNSAEYLERVFYVCPKCGLSKHESHGDTIECLNCGTKARYLPDLTFEGVGCEFPYKTVSNWYDAQNDFIRELDLSKYIDEPMFTDTANISEVIIYKNKADIKNDAEIRLFGDRITVSDEKEEILFDFKFNELMAVSVLGRNKLNIYHNKKVYQLKGDYRFNALKYLNIYHHFKNREKGETSGEFLGL